VYAFDRWWFQHQCLFFFRTLISHHPGLLNHDVIFGFFLKCQTDWTAVFVKLEVYCASSPRRYPSIRQHPLYSVVTLYMCYTSTDHLHIHPRHSLHPPVASTQHLLTPKPSHPSHVIGSFVTGMSITLHIKKPGQLCGSTTSETSCDVVETETMEILNETKCQLGDNKGATDGNDLETTIRFTWMYPPFLTSMLASKGLCS